MALVTMRCHDPGMTTAATYAEFAARETHGVSPAYERLSVAVSRDDEVLALLSTLPPAKRQPNLLFGVIRFLGGPVEDPAAVHDYTVTNWPAIEAEMRARATQTNEAGRCAILLPVLAALPQPLALLDGCRHRRTARSATCSRWTGHRSPGPGHTGRRSSGSGQPECRRGRTYRPVNGPANSPACRRSGILDPRKVCALGQRRRGRRHLSTTRPAPWGGALRWWPSAAWPGTPSTFRRAR
jgi:hypothetical protein